MKILIVEDDVALADDLARRLGTAGHEAFVAGDLAAARHAVPVFAPSVAVLDRVLPDGEGLDFIPWLREHLPDVSVLVLSALVGLDARVGGLNAGADDYLGKPYAFEELLARIAALGRRGANSATRLRTGTLALDRLARKAHAGEAELKLDPREFALLEYLLLHGGEVVTRAMILRDVWGYDLKPTANVVDVYVSRLRTKLEERGCAGMLRTRRGVGYCLRAEES